MESKNAAHRSTTLAKKTKTAENHDADRMLLDHVIPRSIVTISAQRTGTERDVCPALMIEHIE